MARPRRRSRSARGSRCRKPRPLVSPAPETADAVLARALDALEAEFGATIAFVALLDGSRPQVRSHVARAIDPNADDDPYRAHVLAADDVFVAPARDDARAPVLGVAIAAYAAVPLVGPSGARLGVLGVGDARARRFQGERMQTLVSLGKIVAAYVDARVDAGRAVAANDELAAVIAATPSAIAVARRDGTIVTWNAAAQRMFGWTADDLARSDAAFVPPELRDEASDMRRRVMDGGERSIVVASERMHRDGYTIDVEMTVVPVVDASGASVMCAASIEDVTSRNRTRDAERRRVEVLELAATDAPLATILERIVASVETAVVGTTCSILRFENGHFVRAADDDDAAAPPFVAAMSSVRLGPSSAPGNGVPGLLQATVIAEDVFADERWVDFHDAAREFGVRSCWSTPIRDARGIALGALFVYAGEPRRPSPFELRLVHEAAHLAAIAVNGYDARVRLEQSALHDPLTGLPNRTLFEERLREAIAAAKGSKKYIALGILDLDRFKIINDTLGHAVGDQLLLEVASRLRRVVRAEDTIARMGGDEFLLLVADVEDRQTAREIAQRFLRELEPSFLPDGNEVFVRASIGLSCYPEDAVEPSRLLRLADRAMYAAKAAGSGIAFHEPSAERLARSALTLETALNHALDDGELRLAYQPIFRLGGDGGIASVEALVRWRHGTGGDVAPDRFIGTAEETGLIVPIGAWALREACAFSARWSAAGGTGSVAVNVSPRQFEDRAFVDTVVDAVRASGIDPQRLVLEITEGLLMRSPETAAATLADLRRFGVRCAIDDFGTGYSSLTYLKRFPIASLKIDRSFLSELGSGVGDDEAIVRAIVGIGAALGLTVIAEGVETPEQLELVRTLGCDFAQGFLLSEPLSEAALLGPQPLSR